MTDFLELPTTFGLSRSSRNEERSKLKHKLPKWLLLYVVTPEADGHDAEVRLACRATRVVEHVGTMKPTDAQECQIWFNKGVKPTQRKGEVSKTQSMSFCAWKFDKVFRFREPVCVERSQIAGRQLQKVSNVSADVWHLCWASKGCQLMPSLPEEKRFSDLSPAKGWLVQVPGAMALLGSETMPSEPILWTPASVAASLHVTVEKESPSLVEAAEAEAEAGAALAGRVAGMRLQPIQEIHTIRLTFALQNSSDLPVVVNSVIRFLGPFIGDPDPTKLAAAMASIPGRYMLRSGMLKLDMLHMRFRRSVMQQGLAQQMRIARYLSMDASPQGGYEYLCMTEEVMERSQPVVLPECPFSGFTYTQRTMPIMTLARGETRTFVKAQRLKHAICLESSLKHLDLYRSQVKGWVSDQGTEKAVPQTFLGDSAQLQDMTSSLQDGSPTLEAMLASSKQSFLWNSYCGTPGICTSCSMPWKKLAKATQQEKQTVQGYHGELLSWRWESLHHTLRHYVHVRPVLQKYLNPEMLSSEAGFIDHLSAFLSDPWHQGYVEWALMFSGFVQTWAHWLEGCFCHEEQLQQARTRKARDKLKCPWKGRRTSVLIAGCKDRMLQALQSHGSARFKEAMLELPQEVSAAMVLMNSQARDKWSAVLSQKTSYLDHVPHKLAGAFAHLADPGRYSLSGSKRIVQECFAEYVTLKSQGRTTALLSGLFERSGMGETADQLWAYANSPDTKQLRDFPLAWVEVQERAFCTNVERMTERQHVLVKIAGHRTLRFAGPAMTCVRARRDQLQQMIDDPQMCAFLVSNWRRRTIFRELLEHVMSAKDCNKSSFAHRVSRIYGYHEKDHFLDEMEEEEKSGLALGNAVAGALRDVGSVRPHLEKQQWMMVDFIKSQLPTGTVFSLPEFLLGSLLGEPLPESQEQHGPLDLEGFADSLLPGDIPELVAREHVFCSVLDAWPERRTEVQTLRAIGNDRKGHMNVVHFLNVNLSNASQPVVSYKNVQHRTLDFSHVATLPFLKLFSSLCHVWGPRCKSFKVEVLPLKDQAARMSSELPVTLPQFTTDDDMLADLAGQAIEDQELRLREPGDGPDVGAGLSTAQEESMLNQLLKHRAIGDKFVESSTLKEYHGRAVQSLVEKGVVQVRWDDFGESSLAMSSDMNLSTLLLLTEPEVFAVHKQDLSNPAGRNKVGWLRGLLVKSWKPRGKDKDPEWRVKGSRKLLPANLLDSCELHLVCLALEDSIWQKPGDLRRICHGGSADYYQMPRKAPDLTGVQEWTVQQCREFRDKKRKATRTAPRHTGSGAKASTQEPLRLALELPVEPRVKCRVAGLEDLVIYFDNFTHQSGHRRAFCQCLQHADCRRYTFVKNHRDQDEAVAWLLAWASSGPRFDDAEEHVKHNPSDTAVQSMEERQRQVGLVLQVYKMFKWGEVGAGRAIGAELAWECLAAGGLVTVQSALSWPGSAQQGARAARRAGGGGARARWCEDSEVRRAKHTVQSALSWPGSARQGARAAWRRWRWSRCQHTVQSALSWPGSAVRAPGQLGVQAAVGPVPNRLVASEQRMPAPRTESRAPPPPPAPPHVPARKVPEKRILSSECYSSSYESEPEAPKKSAVVVEVAEDSTAVSVETVANPEPRERDPEASDSEKGVGHKIPVQSN
ncbi:unnamed protein product [Symbiodinium sp. CCMP2592]|nr:unnamed protein product [Symbiodinium sp. CCMP2592]